jgi:hypothetical protein
MRIQPQALLLALAVAPLVGACDDDDCYDCSGWQDVYEVEPNDLPSQANWLGTLYPGDRIAIRGRISELGPDLLDGFALRSGTAIGVQFALWADVPGADLDLCLYDPDLGAYVACWETSAHPEAGGFSILGPGKDVHLVVSSFLGDSTYTLELWIYETCCGDGAAPEGGVLTDASAGPHRAGTEDRWAAYLAGEQAATEPEPRVLRPGHLIEIDLDSGAIRRRPLLLEELPLR